VVAVGAVALLWAAIAVLPSDGGVTNGGGVDAQGGASRPGGVGNGTASPGVRTTAANWAARLRTLPSATTQVVVVHADRYDATRATLETFGKVDGVWRPVFAAMPVWIGEHGFTDTPAEGLSSTPVGVFGFGDTMYGVSPDPGVRYPYHVLIDGDYWDENVSSLGYNTFVHGANPGGASEALWRSPVAYRHFAVITYNMPAVPGKGSGIFLHASFGKPTAGCVALEAPDLVRVLTWLDPRAAPRIVMGPTGVLGRY
jgi:L,D-peptidoglycan transpeptidase YkuD (ErfK/YbiS/YcfS/YnhG family)